jgi:hypothetical protein
MSCQKSCESFWTFRLMPSFRKVERAKAIIQDGKELFLKECAKCGTEFYGAKDETRCEQCRKRKNKSNRRNEKGEPVA